MLACMTRPFRIGAGAGYAGDRIEPAAELAEHGRLDVLAFECLAERTIALAQAERLRDPARGFDPLLEARLEAVLPACRRNGVRIVSNMGAANPRGAARAAAAVARRLASPATTRSRERPRRVGRSKAATSISATATW